MIVASALTPIRRLLADKSGASASEFVLILPLFVLLITATIDFGGMVYRQLQVGSAARAGASYAAAKGYNVAGITAAVEGGTTIESPNTALTETCGCPAAGGVTEVTCGDTCPDDEPAGTYVTVTVNADHDFIFSWPGLKDPTNLSSTARVRIP